MPEDLPTQLQQRAGSIPDFEKSQHDALGKVHGVDELTDGLMILVLMAVEERAQLSVNAKKRLLARLVINVMGAQVSLSNPKADVVGLRLRKQAREVQAKMVRVVEDALEERQQLRTTAGDDDALAAALPGRLEELAALEQAALDMLRLEVYVGFKEVYGAPVKVQPGSVGAGAGAAQEQPTLPLPRWLCGDRGSLVACGGVAARIAQAYREHNSAYLAEPVEWPGLTLDWFDCPSYLRIIVDALVTSEAELKLMRAKAEWHEREYYCAESEMVRNAEERADKLQAEVSELNDDKVELCVEIERAKGREEALQRAVERAYRSKSK